VIKLAQDALKANGGQIRTKVSGVSSFHWAYDGVTVTQRSSKKTRGITVSTVGMSSDDLDINVIVTTGASCHEQSSRLDLASLDDG
jgi:hypothetical protein